jgi:hypothetical protein
LCQHGGVASSFCRHCAALTDRRHFAWLAAARCIGKPARAGYTSRKPGPVLPAFEKKALHNYFKLTGSETMSIFGKIMGAIFGSKAAATPASGGAPAGGAPAGSAAAPSSAPVAPPQSVDVAAIVDKAAAAKGEKLEWRTSIVDLMKALDIDSSLSARKELAKELGYTGDSNDSASMNIWLHKQVMAKLAANGGKLPPEIKH